MPGVRDEAGDGQQHVARLFAQVAGQAGASLNRQGAVAAAVDFLVAQPAAAERFPVRLRQLQRPEQATVGAA
jgi:hypothetical protein